MSNNQRDKMIRHIIAALRCIGFKRIARVSEYYDDILHERVYGKTHGKTHEYHRPHPVRTHDHYFTMPKKHVSLEIVRTAGFIVLSISTPKLLRKALVLRIPIGKNSVADVAKAIKKHEVSLEQNIKIIKDSKTYDQNRSTP